MKEFNDHYPLILSLPAGEFILNLTKRVGYVNAKKFNVFSNTLKTKVEQYFISVVFPLEYKIAFTAMKAINKKLESNTDYQSFKGNFTPHCQNNSKAIHSCGNNLYLFSYNKTIEGYYAKESYIVCPTCNEIYKDNFVKLNCNECDVDFYSKINNDKANINPVMIENKYQLATWESYHCNVVVNDCMRCFQCQNPFYIDTSFNGLDGSSYLLLTCLKCNTSIKDNKAFWKYIKCKQEFISKAKLFNSLEYKNIKLCVLEAIVNKEKAKPSKVPCCKIDINQTKFYHNSKCKGELVFGTLNKKKIVICCKCETINEYQNYQWICPKCNEKIKLSIPTKLEIESDNQEKKHEIK